MGKLEDIRSSNDKAYGINQKSDGGLSPYVQQMLGAGAGGAGAYVSPSYAFWLYDNSDTIQDAVNRIAWAFSQIQPALKDKNTGEFLTKPSDHPFLELLDSPGFEQDSTQLMFESMVSFCITGNTFPIAKGNVNFEPISLETISANKTSLIPNENNKLYSIQFTNNEDQNIYKRQTIPKRKTLVFQSDSKLSETMQIMIKKATSGVQAQTPLRAIYYQAMTKYYGGVHNSGLLKNGARPSGLWNPAKEGISQDNYEAFKKEVTKMTGAYSAGNNIVAPVAVNYENLLLNPRDMDFVKLIENNREEIYNSYQIPMPLVSTGTMTNSNFENAITAFYDLAVLPRARFILKRLGEFLLPRYKGGDRYELTYDEKTLTALKGRMFKEAETMRKVGAFSQNEIRSTVGYESIGTEGDAIMVPANLVDSMMDDDYTDDNIIKPGDDE